MRVLLVSDAPWHTTGYGTQTALLAKKMVADGHRVYVYAPGALHGGKVDDWNGTGITVLSSQFGDDRWGNQTLAFHLNEVQPDVVLTWLDAHGLAAYGLGVETLWVWAPIDTEPIPKEELAILGRAARIFVPSKWGQRVLADAGFASEYIPCGLDLDAWHIDPEGRKRFRSALPDVPEDAFLIGMVGLNTGMPDRKGYGFAFEVLQRFMADHADAYAFIHTNVAGDGQSMNLITLRERMGLADRIGFTPPMGPLGVEQSWLNDAYNAFDVLLHTAITEGFGIPVVEAQACGTPVVVNACTSVTELAEGNYLAEPKMEMYVSTETRVSLPDTDALLAKLEDAYRDRKSLDREAVRERVLYLDKDKVYEWRWRPLLETVPDRLEVIRGRKLQLAAGTDQRDGYTHHDRIALPGIDVVHDLEVFPWPWADDSWDYIEFSDCLEHLKGSVVQVMDELHRIIALGGHLYIHTAEVGSWQLYKDPTHIRGFDLDAMDYFDHTTGWGTRYPYSDRDWKLIKKTTDNHGGLIFVMQPRKEALVPA